MDKEQAKKYIQGRKLEIMCELELPQEKKWKKRLEREFAFLRYVGNVIGYAEEYASLANECDVFPAQRIFEHKGYILQQSEYNNRFMIFKDGKMVCHSQCTEKLDKKKAEENIDFFIDLMNGKIKQKEVIHNG